MSFFVGFFVTTVAGFIALSYEILWYRAISFTSWSLPGAFGLLLGFYLLGLANGARRSALYCRTNPGVDASALRTLAALVFASNLASYAIVPLLARVAAVTWMGGLLLIAIAATLLGAILPLVSHLAIAADDRAGQRLSYLYLGNILGSAAGSLITGFVFLDAWSLERTSNVLLLAGMALVAILVVAGGPSPGRERARALAGIVAVCALAVGTSAFSFGQLYERLLYKDRFDGSQHFRTSIENRHGVISVTHDDVVLGGGAYDGAINVSLRKERNQLWHAFAVGALHPAPKRVLAIGLSSGSWAQVLANLKGVEHLTVVEINPGYLPIIASAPDVASLLTNPKVTIAIDDGRRWVQRHPDEKFDVIVMNTIFHWRAHATNLLSREFLEMVRTRLTPGGLMYMNASSSDDVLRTATATFPEVLRIDWYVAASTTPLKFDRDRWRATLISTKIDGRPALREDSAEDRAFIDRYNALPDAPPDNEAWRGFEGRDSILRRVAAADVITDDNMVSEWRTLLRFPAAP